MSINRVEDNISSTAGWICSLGSESTDPGCGLRSDRLIDVTSIREPLLAVPFLCRSQTEAIRIERNTQPTDVLMVRTFSVNYCTCCAGAEYKSRSRGCQTEKTEVKI